MEEEIINKREKKVLNWIKNPYNATFLSIIIFATLIRLYYFILTYNQPLWWDEAEYMLMARAFISGSSYTFMPVRQILNPFLISIFLRFTESEFFIRFFTLLLSITSVVAIYYLGKELFNKKVGLISSFFMSVFYLGLFFTYRILVDMHSITFFILSALFFYKYIKYDSKKSLYIGAVLIAIGGMFKLSTAFLLGAFLIYILLTEKLKFLKKKELWIAGIIFFFVMSPYLIWGYMEFGSFVLFDVTEYTAPRDPATGLYYEDGDWSSKLSHRANTFKNYLRMYPNILFQTANKGLLAEYLGTLVILGVLGWFFTRLILGLDLLLKTRGDMKLKRDLYMASLLVIPVILISSTLSHNEQRYILNSCAVLFIIFASIILKIYSSLKKKNRALGIIVVFVLLGYFAFIQLGATDSLIKMKLNSYSEVRDAAYWIKQNTDDSALILSESAHQMGYYSERAFMRFPDLALEDLSDFIKKNKPNYYVVSLFERLSPETYSYPEENNFTVVQVYFADPQKTQPIIIIYKIPDSFYEGKNQNIIILEQNSSLS